MATELEFIKEAIARAIGARVAEIDEALGQQHAQAESLEALKEALQRFLRSRELEQIARHTAEALADVKPRIESELVQLFQRTGGPVRTSDALNYLVNVRRVPLTPDKLADIMSSSPLFHRTGKGWWQLVDESLPHLDDEVYGASLARQRLLDEPIAQLGQEVPA